MLLTRFALVVGALASAGCLSSLFGQELGDGAARLSVREAGALASLIANDTRCGLASAVDVLEGEPGGPGRSIRSVTGCAFDVQSFALEGCTSTTKVSGRFVVDAVRTIEGTLTGRSDDPVLPRGPDAATITVSARVEELRVDVEGSDNVLVHTGGTISFIAHPLLAASADSGACAIPTAHVRFAELAVTDAKLRVITPDLELDVSSASSILTAVNGRVGDQENLISGVIDIDGRPIVVAAGALDVDYDPASFESSFSCADDLAIPVDFACGSPSKLVGSSAMRLVVSGLANLAAALDADATCGFNGRPVDVIEAGDGVRGTAVFRVRGCAIGDLVVDADKRVRGRLTGDALTPVVPETSDAVEIRVLSAAGAVVIATEQANLELTEVRGLAGTVSPRLALGEDGICNVATPHAVIEANIDAAHATLVSGALRLPAALDGLALAAVNGRIDNRENVIDGAVAVDGVEVALAGAQLDPGYDRAPFDEAVDALPGIVVPTRFDCNLRSFIGLNAGRLVMKTVGDIAGRLGDDGECGFGNVLNLLTPDTIEPGDGSSTATLVTQACTLPTTPTENCLGVTTAPFGDVVVDGSLRIVGNQVFGTNLVLPTAPDATQVTLSEARLTQFGVTEADASGTPGSAHVALTGTLSAVVSPRLAQGIPGIFDVSTPVAVVEVASARLEAVFFVTKGDSLLALPVVLEDIALRGVNGPVDGEENALSGSLTVDGLVVAIDAALDPDPSYSAAGFDASYSCDVAPVGR